MSRAKCIPFCLPGVCRHPTSSPRHCHACICPAHAYCCVPLFLPSFAALHSRWIAAMNSCVVRAACRRVPNKLPAVLGCPNRVYVCNSRTVKWWLQSKGGQEKQLPTGRGTSIERAEQYTGCRSPEGMGHASTLFSQFKAQGTSSSTG